MLFRIQPLCDALESNITKGTSTILLTKHCIIISVIDYPHVERVCFYLPVSSGVCTSPEGSRMITGK